MRLEKKLKSAFSLLKLVSNVVTRLLNTPFVFIAVIIIILFIYLFIHSFFHSFIFRDHYPILIINEL